MVTWVNSRRQVVGHVSQGVRYGANGLPMTVYVAEAVGLAADTCPRFACAKKKVEGALLVAGVRAKAIL